MTLSIKVFNGGYVPVDGGPAWTGPDSATWPASTATLIAGDHEAVLVDALMTIDQGERLAAWITHHHRTVTDILVTHGHGDHFFGAGPVLRAFPKAGLVALAHVVEESRTQLLADSLANWSTWFGDRYDTSPALPTVAASDVVGLEGHSIALQPVGPADGMAATVVRIDALDTVCAGDAVYNNVHMWLWNSTPETRETWLTTIDTVADLSARTIIAGHRDPGAQDDAAERQVSQSRRYIEDFDRAVSHCTTGAEVIETMTRDYGHFGNPYTLFVSAHSQFA
jgi:glyoxylase-like metal-dependent hydrolase (beta-lactamase superfamily II)